MRNESISGGLPFMKMHGLGNDFVVIDQRSVGDVVTSALAQALGDRHCGVGFDQLAVLKDGDNADVDLMFYNSDGTTSAACGNATRCIAEYEMKRNAVESMTLRTERGLLHARRGHAGMVSVNMGAPLFDWRAIPLARAIDTLELPIDGAPTATGMGNPHCSFFVDDAEAVDLETRGAELEYHPLFPERTNVQFASVIGENHLRMRVWERGVGVTLASGSSSCAVAVAASRRGLTGKNVRIELDGGQLLIDWEDDGVWMTGPTSHVFSGTLTPEFLGQL